MVRLQSFIIFLMANNTTVPFHVSLYIGLFSMSSLVGVAGNILVSPISNLFLAGRTYIFNFLQIVFAILVSKVLRNIRNAFIFNLAVADLSVAAVTMPMSILGRKDN